MALIPVYSDLQEKKNAFKQSTINTMQEFTEEINKLPDNLFYRGINAAKFKIYSSSQRDWISNNLVTKFGNYDVYINTLINSARNVYSGFLHKLLSSYRSPVSDLAILSFLQHYGAPTPLIDFSLNKYKALFFAIDGATISGTNNIDNYISLYAISTTQDFTNLIDILSQAHARISDIEKSQPPNSILNINQLKANLDTYSQAVAWDSPLCINDNGLNSSDYTLGINSNPNIIAQEGLFILNPTDSDAIEELFDGVSLSVWSKLGLTSTSRLFYDKLFCLDIHKSLLPDITNTLLSMNICKDTIYPQNDVLVKTIYTDAMKI